MEERDQESDGNKIPRYSSPSSQEERQQHCKAFSFFSEEDNTWVKAEAKKAAMADADKAAAAAFAESDFGKALSKMQVFDGKKYCDHELEAAPKLFLLYFSASW